MTDKATAVKKKKPATKVAKKKQSAKVVKDKKPAIVDKEVAPLKNPEEEIATLNIEEAIDDAMKPYLDRDFTEEEQKLLDDYKKLKAGKVLLRVEEYKKEKKFIEDNKEEIEKSEKEREIKEATQKEEFQRKQQETFESIAREKSAYTEIVSKHIDKIEPSVLAAFEKKLVRTKFRVQYNPSFIVDQHGSMSYEIKVIYTSKLQKYLGNVERTYTGYISTPIQKIVNFKNLKNESKKNLEKFDKLLSEGIDEAVGELLKRKK